MVLRETLLFSTDATVVATLYGSGNSTSNGGNSSSSGGSNGVCGGSNGGSNSNSGGFSYVYCDDDASVTMTDDGQGLLVDIHNNNNNHNNSNNNHNNSKSLLSSSNISPQLRSAMEKKLLLLVACALVIPGQPPSFLQSTLCAIHIRNFSSFSLIF